jgi:acyl phosphate:glycerol-3-phosphate acyltransferase
MGVLAAVIGYTLGSIPFALLLTRTLGVDLRAIGSRNVGAANVLRSAGIAPAITAMLLDAAKGAIAVVLAGIVSDDLRVVTIAGVAAVVGHVYPPWLGFRGGKGVATSAGVFTVLAPLATAVAVLVFVGTIVVTRFISAGSILGALALPIAAVASDAPGAIIGGTVASALIVLTRHRGNISRLITGTERRIGLRL